MKKTLIVILCAILLGGGIAYYLFDKVVVKASPSNNSSANAFQIGAFTNYDNAIKVSDRNNGIVIIDKDIYRVYVAILSNDEAIFKLKNYYNEIGLNYYLKQITVSKEFLNQIEEIENMIKMSSSDTYSILTKEILKKYEEMQ